MLLRSALGLFVAEVQDRSGLVRVLAGIDDDVETVGVERVIKVPPGAIFSLLADADKHASFDGSESVNHAAQKSVSPRKGPPHPWKATGLGDLIGGRIWRYALSPADGGTLVRETWDVSQDKQKRMITSGPIPKQTEKGMAATMGRIAQLLES